MPKQTYTITFGSLKQMDDTMDTLFQKLETYDVETEEGEIYKLLRVLLKLDKARKSRRKAVELSQTEGKVYLQAVREQLMEPERLDTIKKVLRSVDRIRRIT